VTFKDSLALPPGLLEPLSCRLNLPEIATPSMQLQKSLQPSALSIVAITKIAETELATLDLKKACGAILGIPGPLVSLWEGFNRPETPKLTRRGNGRPNYIEYATEIDKLPTTGLWSLQTSSIQFFYGRNSFFGDLLLLSDDRIDSEIRLEAAKRF